MSDTTQTHLRCRHTDCEEPADWRIVYGNMPDDYTEACVNHVNELLVPGKLCTVYTLGGMTDLGGLKCSPSCVDIGIKRMESMKQGVRDLRRSFDEHFSGKTVEEVWDEFWADIVCKNGRLDREQIKKELYDFKMLLSNVVHVYCHVTGDTISKPLTDPKVVCQLADEHYREVMFEEFKEASDGDEHAAVAVDVSGLPEFDRLLTLLQTIYLLTDDTRVRAFIEAEVQQLNLPDRPLAHTFDLLAEAQRRPLHLSEEQRTYIHAAAVDLSVPISYLDDARQMAVEGTAEHAVLETLQKYLEALAANDQPNN